VAVGDEGAILTSGDPLGGGGAAAGTWHSARIGAIPLTGVSCPSASLCLAWGPRGIESSSNPAGGAGAWTHTSLDHGAPVDSASCPTISLCVAVAGANSLLTSTNAGAGRAARWKLTAAHIDMSRSTAFGAATVTALSCPAVSLCVAVDSAGRVLTSSDPTRERPWSVADVDPRVETLPGVPAGAEPGLGAMPPTFADARLTAVSCPSVKLCVAVDEYGTIAYSFDPTGGAHAWKLSNDHAGILRTGTSDVSCASVSLCVYVGATGLTGYTPGSVRVADGPPDLRSSYSTRRIDTTYLTAVACVPAGFCVAIDQRASIIVGVVAPS
jgi:hypothetical protein